MGNKEFARSVAKAAALEVYNTILKGAFVKRASNGVHAYRTKDLAKAAAVAVFKTINKSGQNRIFEDTSHYAEVCKAINAPTIAQALVNPGQMVSLDAIENEWPLVQATQKLNANEKASIANILKTADPGFNFNQVMQPKATQQMARTPAKQQFSTSTQPRSPGNDQVLWGTPGHTDPNDPLYGL